MAVTFAPSEPLNNFMNELNAISSKGQFNERMKLPAPPKPQMPPGWPGTGGVGPGAGTGVTPGTGGTGSDLDRLMRAIRGQESGGRYDATNPSGASGAYQILRSNFEGAGGWDKEALGRDISYQEFMNSPQLQDAIARFKLGQYLKSRGLAGAAATWYGGEWGYKNMYNKKPQGGYPSMYEYVMSILNRY